MRARLTAFVLAAVALSGCYQVTVETGLPASTETIEKPFAMGFIGGLVPPPTVETASKCKNGVSKVESSMSPVNWLVGALTFGVLSPWTIKVTCAASSKMGALPTDAVKVAINPSASSDEYGRALAVAAQLSHELSQPVYVTR